MSSTSGATVRVHASTIWAGVRPSRSAVCRTTSLPNTGLSRAKPALSGKNVRYLLCRYAYLFSEPAMAGIRNIRYHTTGPNVPAQREARSIPPIWIVTTAGDDPYLRMRIQKLGGQDVRHLCNPTVRYFLW
jgi:hypothetical protein